MPGLTARTLSSCVTALTSVSKLAGPFPVPAPGLFAVALCGVGEFGLEFSFTPLVIIIDCCISNLLPIFIATHSSTFAIELPFPANITTTAFHLSLPSPSHTDSLRHTRQYFSNPPILPHHVLVQPQNHQTAVRLRDLGPRLSIAFAVPAQPAPQATIATVIVAGRGEIEAIAAAPGGGEPSGRIPSFIRGHAAV